jgi:hypothetical protein
MTLVTAMDRCLSELDALYDRTSLHSSEALLDVGAVAELVLAAPDVQALSGVRVSLARAALGWLKTGLLQEIIITKMEFCYIVALLVQLARIAPEFKSSDISQFAALVASGMIGRTEMPTLTMRVMASAFGQPTLQVTQGVGQRPDFLTIVDKRVLRRRTDEYDIATMLMVAQVIPVEDSGPRIFPQVLLIDALRQQHENYVAVLAFINRFAFEGAPPAVMEAARIFLLSAIKGADGLLSTPDESYLYSEFLERSDLGLRLRSTLACIAFLEEE